MCVDVRVFFVCECESIDSVWDEEYVLCFYDFECFFKFHLFSFGEAFIVGFALDLI